MQGFVNNTLQTSLARFCFNFRGKDITHYSAGTALVGVFVAGVAFILQLTIKDLDIQYWVYLGFVTFMLLVTTFIFMAFFKTFAKELKNHQMAYDQVVDGGLTENGESSDLAGTGKNSGASNDQKLLQDSVGQPSITGEDMGTKVCEVIWQNAQKESWAEKCNAMTTLYPLFFVLVLCYTSTLSTYPSLCFAAPIVPKDGSAIIILIYNFGDFLGKLVYGCLPIKDGMLPLFYVVIRAVLINGMYYLVTIQAWDDLMGNWVVNYILILLMSLTNGHLTSACFNMAPARVSDRLKKYSGFIMTMALLIGLWYGAFVSFVVSL